MPLGIPFSSSWGGVKMISWNNQCASRLEDQPEQTGATVYPNPASGKLFVHFTGMISRPITTITIYDPAGRNVYETVAYPDAEKNSVLDLPSLAPGNYWVELRNGEGTLMKKIFLH